MSIELFFWLMGTLGFGMFCGLALVVLYGIGKKILL
jgi:hypothetical protein